MRSVPLCDDVFFACDGLQRNVVVDRRVAHHDTSGVSTCAASQSFQFLSDVEQLVNFRITVVCLFEFLALLNCVLQFDVEFIGDRLRNLIDTSQRDAERSADVTNRELRLKCAERSDLTDVCAAVFLLRVVDHFLPTIAAEVDVDIGWFGTASVEESFEEQVVLQRADMAESQ